MSSLNRRHVGSHDCHVVAENKLRQYGERGTDDSAHRLLAQRVKDREA